MMHIKYLKKHGIQSYHDLEAFLNRDEVKQMIGKNYDHYRELWLTRYEYMVMKEPKKKVKGSFNWLALLCFFVWTGYRRMYAMTISVGLVLAGLCFAEEYYNLSRTSLLGMWVVMAIMSKDFYFGHILSCMKKIDAMPNQERVEHYLKLRSGTSIVGAILALPFAMLLMFLAILLAQYIKSGAF